MSRVKMFNIDNTTVYVDNLGTLDELFFIKRGRIPTCPLCSVDFRVGDTYTILRSYQKLFPDIGVHTDCFTGESDIRKLIDDYQKFKAIKFKYRHWLVGC